MPTDRPEQGTQDGRSHGFLLGAARWALANDAAGITDGLPVPGALEGGREFLRMLREGEIATGGSPLQAGAIDVLHAACVILAQAGPESLRDAERLWGFLEATSWEPDFEERAELLAACAFAGWRAAGRFADAGSAATWVKRHAGQIEGPVHLLVMEALNTPRTDREAYVRLSDPEVMLALCGVLHDRMNTSPASVREEAEALYRFIEAPKREIGLFDEREYFLGEAALLAGTACRCLSMREEAWLWFDRAEAGFRRSMNAPGELSRLGYQRLAERFEERQIDVVLELLPSLVESFQKLGMPEDGLKCRFLEGLAYVEMDKPAHAVRVFTDIRRDAEALGSDRLLAEAYVNLIHAHAMLGEADEAIEASRRAIPLLRRLENRTSMGKIRWGLAILLREKGQLGAAIESYRKAQEEFEAIGMRADIAALNLVVADLLLEQGQDREALREISLALPVISELKMAPEGMAALSLLRESARRQEINRQALRELHGYFQELGS